MLNELDPRFDQNFPFSFKVRSQIRSFVLFDLAKTYGCDFEFRKNRLAPDDYKPDFGIVPAPKEEGTTQTIQTEISAETCETGDSSNLPNLSSFLESQANDLGITVEEAAGKYRKSEDPGRTLADRLASQTPATIPVTLQRLTVPGQ